MIEIDTHPILDLYNPNLPIKENPIINAPYDEIILLIDVSCSTDNMYTINPEERSKPILIAEMEASAIILGMLCNNLKFNDIIFKFCSFSKNCKIDTFKYNNNDLWDFIKNFKKYINLEFSSTNLLEALEKTVLSINNKLIIIATDGRPDDGQEEFIKKLLNKNKILHEQNNKIMDIILIGAGSIINYTHGTIATYCTRKIKEPACISTNNKECNMKFLTELRECSTDLGLYLPAWKDYSDLKICFIKALNEIKIYNAKN